MRLKRLGATRSVLMLENGDEILFSYDTPVAGILGGTPVRTDQFYSRTTSAHVAAYHEGRAGVLVVPQARIDEYLKGAR